MKKILFDYRIPDFERYTNDQQFVNVTDALLKIETDQGGLTPEELWEHAINLLESLKYVPRAEITVKRMFSYIIDEMRKNGIFVRLTEEESEHYAVIDRKMVWHGGMNLLGKADAWDNLIRVENAQAFTMDLFNTFIAVGSLAALGYAVMVVILFVQTVRGKIYPSRWMCLLNPFLIMIVCIVLSKVLPRTAFVNGVFGLGQQSIGLFILFVTLHLTCKNSNQS